MWKFLWNLILCLIVILIKLWFMCSIRWKSQGRNWETPGMEQIAKMKQYLPIPLFRRPPPKTMLVILKSQNGIGSNLTDSQWRNLGPRSPSYATTDSGRQTTDMTDLKLYEARVHNLLADNKEATSPSRIRRF